MSLALWLAASTSSASRPAVERDPNDARRASRAATGRGFCGARRRPPRRGVRGRASSRRARSRGGGGAGPRLAGQVLGGARESLSAPTSAAAGAELGALLLGARDHAALELDGLGQRRLVDEAERE